MEERTAKFGENIIELCRKVPKDAVTLSIISQLVRSGTSIGANYSVITVRQTEHQAEKTLKIKYLFVKKNQLRLNIG